jgi:hypothetical protein
MGEEIAKELFDALEQYLLDSGWLQRATPEEVAGALGLLAYHHVHVCAHGRAVPEDCAYLVITMNGAEMRVRPAGPSR